MPIISGGAGGGGGGVVRLFDSSLVGAATNIDTGANGIASGYSSLLFVFHLRSAEAVTRNSSQLTFNADTGANYMSDIVQAAGTTASGSAGVSEAFIRVEAPGALAAANFFSTDVLFVPNYTDTSAAKSAVHLGGSPVSVSSSTNNRIIGQINVWTGTAAISQATITAASGANFAIGSRMSIYGLL